MSSEDRLGRDVSDSRRRIMGHTLANAIPVIVADRLPAEYSDWIDYRRSCANVFRRRDQGANPELCTGCQTEVDSVRVAHSPRCTTFRPVKR